MNRTRCLLLGLAVGLMMLAGRAQVEAVPCEECICLQNCEAIETQCLDRCDGNGTCETNCEHEYATCYDGCLGIR